MGKWHKETKGKRVNKRVGRWTIATHTEQGTGIKLVGKCNKYNLAITNPMFAPKKDR